MAKATIPYSPVWPERLLRIRLKSGKAKLDHDYGRLLFCVRCDEYWPADSEFFFTRPSNTDGLNNWCKACFKENMLGLPPYKLNKELIWKQDQ